MKNYQIYNSKKVTYHFKYMMIFLPLLCLFCVLVLEFKYSIFAMMFYSMFFFLSLSEYKTLKNRSLNKEAQMIMNHEFIMWHSKIIYWENILRATDLQNKYLKEFELKVRNKVSPDSEIKAPFYIIRLDLTNLDIDAPRFDSFVEAMYRANIDRRNYLLDKYFSKHEIQVDEIGD